MIVLEQRPSFEDVYAALEAAVGRLEEGGLPLDDAIAAYEEGVRLAQSCRDLLDAAELRVMTLAEALGSAAGQPTGADEDDDEE